MKTAVLDAGGGLRGIYGSGVLDACLELGIRFDITIGVSAGSANMCSYVAGQKGRNYVFYKDYSARKNYMSFTNFRETGNFVNMDYIYGTLSNKKGEYPLDFKAIKKSPQELFVVATNALTGKPVYFSKEEMEQDHYDIVKASCSIPIVNKPYYVKNTPFFDGALSDPIPLEKAFSLGAEKVVLILTKPEDTIRKPYKDSLLAAFMNHYPKAAKKLRSRAARYNEAVEWAKQLESEGKVLILSPDSTCGVDTLKRKPTAIHDLYLKGYQDGHKVAEFLKQNEESIQSSFFSNPHLTILKTP